MQAIAVMHMLLVRDMERAIDFYTKTFDFILLPHTAFWTNIDSGHGKIALRSFGNKTELKETTLIIEVDNHKEAAEKINKNGGKVLKITEPYESASVYNVIFIDSENNQVVVSQMVAV